MALPATFVNGQTIDAARLNAIVTGLATTSWAFAVVQQTDAVGGGLRIVKAGGTANGYWDSFLDGGTNQLRFNWNGSGTPALAITTDGYHLMGYTGSNGAFRLQVNSQIFATSGTIATSDGRFKRDVEELSGGVDIIKALRPVSFAWRDQGAPIEADVMVATAKQVNGKTIEAREKRRVVVREPHNFPAGRTVGFIAQDVLAALGDQPWIDNLVKKNQREAVIIDGKEVAPKEEFYGLAEGNLIPILVSAVQELTQRLEALEKPGHGNGKS